ncbi:MAG TPA: hypothetical protein VIV60_03625 [Polyangiaceae bacterium]
MQNQVLLFEFVVHETRLQVVWQELPAHQKDRVLQLLAALLLRNFAQDSRDGLSRRIEEQGHD